MDPIKLVAFVTNMSAFDAQFTSAYYKIVAWAQAFKAEIGIMANVFFKYWNTDAYYSRQLFVTSTMMADFLKPICDLYRPFITTRLANDIWDTVWMSMQKQGQVIPPSISQCDPLTLNNGDLFGQCEQEFDQLLTRSGYKYSIAYKQLPIINTLTGALPVDGMAFKLYTDREVSPIFERYNFVAALEPPRCLIRIDRDLKFPCFRTVLKERIKDDDHWEDFSIRDKVMKEQGIIDVPLYFKWANNVSMRQDYILSQLPTIMPVGIEPMKNIVNWAEEFNAEGNNVISAFGNSMDEYIFLKSTDFDTLFEILTIT